MKLECGCHCTRMSARIVFQDGTKVFTGSCDKTAKMWDLNSNQAIQVAQVQDLTLYISILKCPNSLL